MLRHADTIAALATPVGTSALAIVRLSGTDTRAIAAALAGKELAPRTATYLDYHDRAGNLVDDVVATFFPGPGSYTGEDALEVSCHGNPFIAQKILEDLFARGCRPAQPGEFTQRAFLNGRMDLSQAEAVMDVIHARSERALASAQQQLRGSLGRRIGGLIEQLLAILARVEAYIDFPDEDLPPEDRQVVAQGIAALRAETDRLMATAHYGALLRDGIKTVIVGEPNVGKSSLLNRLVGQERALVSPEPGTTRDFIEERIMVGAHCLRLIDTAGLNAAPAPLEKLGMEKTWERLAEADLRILMLDGSGMKPLELSAELAAVANAGDSIIVLNKSDLRRELQSVALPYSAPTVTVSALTGAGIEELKKTIGQLAERSRREAGADSVAISARHAHALTEATVGLSAAEAKLEGGEPVELLASDLRSALAAYGEITGRVDNERMLDHLFATFCIGK